MTRLLNLLVSVGEYEREYPVWPWRLWGDSEPEKARLEMAIHRSEAAKFYEGEGAREWCGGCGHRTRFRQVSDPEPSPWNGRGGCGAGWSAPSAGTAGFGRFILSPIEVPGLTSTAGSGYNRDNPATSEEVKGEDGDTGFDCSG